MNTSYIKYLVAILTGLLFSISSSATTITIVNTNTGSQGFNSTTPVSPEGGNNATTLGAAYFNVFEAAAEFWEQRLDSPVEIRIESVFTPLICTSTSAQLGGAGPLSARANFANVPFQNTFYSIALANALAGQDLEPGFNDMVAQFNSLLDGRSSCLGGTRWWLGINGQPAPAGTISLFETVLHEMAHGLGFLTFVNQDGERFFNLNDPFMLNLFDLTSNQSWANMSDFQRSRSSLNNGNLVWTGTNVANGAGVITGGRNRGFLRMYAPSIFEPGSSVSHWDTVLSPDELMEPFATFTSDSTATVLALGDMGWPLVGFDIITPVVAPIINLLLDGE